MIIGIDIDDTLTNTKELQIECWKEFVSLHPKEGYDFNLPENINRFGDEYINMFWDLYRETLFAPSFKDNVSEVINNLKQKGYKVYIVTARPEVCYPKLISRLTDVFSSINLVFDNIIVGAKNKSEACCENGISILIDDDIVHCTTALDNGIEAILFNDGYDYPGYQTNSWNNIESIVDTISKSNNYTRVRKMSEVNE